MGEKAPFFQTVNQSTKLRTILNYKLIIRRVNVTGLLTPFTSESAAKPLNNTFYQK
jgi:radical SAM superfamily enzyme with C-terminal helix-hairpin-helix motif